MASNYRKLGDFIKPIELRNSDGLFGEAELRGISVTKEFIETHANLIGVTFEGYKVVPGCSFAYIPDTSRRGDKIAIAFNDGQESLIVSSICSVFKVSEPDKLNSEYLNVWFNRSEFDRYARFKSHGSAREVFDWDQLCVVELPVPDIETQCKIVGIKKCIEARMNSLAEQNDYLLELATTLFEGALQHSCTEVLFGDVVELEDSKRIPLNSRDREQRKGPYPYYGATSIMDYVDDYLFDDIRVLLGEDGTVITDDGRPVLQYVWGKYWVNNHAHILKASSKYPLEMLYVALSRTAITHIVTGAVQMKISQKNLKNLTLEMPEPDSVEELEPIFAAYRANVEESRKLEELRDTLLPKLMSGEIDVSKVDVTQLNNHFKEN